MTIYVVCRALKRQSNPAKLSKVKEFGINVLRGCFRISEDLSGTVDETVSGTH